MKLQPNEPHESLFQLARWMMFSRFTVVLTGAGMSTESGLPDFRSKIFDFLIPSANPYESTVLTASAPTF